MIINHINQIWLFILILLLVILSIGIYLAFFWKKSKKLDTQTLSKIKKHIALTWKWNKSFKEQIMDYDKIYHNILKEIWYNWTFWEILKQKPIIIGDIQKIWDLHKLRNKLAHDFDNIEQKVLQRKSIEFKNEVNKLLKKVS